MFKKKLLPIFIMSPFLFLILGYPIQRTLSQSTDIFPISQRCFIVGNMQQFFYCFKDHERLGGFQFITQLIWKLDALQSGMSGVFVVVFLGQIIFLSFVLNELVDT